jgi:hypothetical protein
MTTRVIALLAACLASATAASSELVFLEGEITEGGFFVSPDGPPFVIRDFPIQYTATFSYDAAIAVATFQFTPLIDDLDTTQVIRENLFPGVLRNDDEALAVDYEPSINFIMNNFELTLDKTTGLGGWRWLETCAVCDRAFDPFANATITEFREALGGDFDEDGDVDGADLTNWKGGFGATSFVSHVQGDADADSDVDGGDFLIWQRQAGKSPAAAVAVPEPYAGLLVSGVAAAPIMRRRRVVALAATWANR